MLERYNPMLSAIKELCPPAHIGGGAVRDTLLERPIRDVDLFLDDAVTETAAKLLRSEFGFVKVGEWKGYDEGFSDPTLARVAKFEKADETIPVCLIGLKQPYEYEERSAFDMKSNLRRFDFGICQAGWDGNEVYSTAEYKIDVEQKSFTLCRADNQSQFDYSMARFNKMTADRYAGWRLAVPKEFETLLAEHTFRKTYYRDYDTGALKFKEGYGSSILTGPKAR